METRPEPAATVQSRTQGPFNWGRPLDECWIQLDFFSILQAQHIENLTTEGLRANWNACDTLLCVNPTESQAVFPPARICGFGRRFQLHYTPDLLEMLLLQQARNITNHLYKGTTKCVIINSTINPPEVTREQVTSPQSKMAALTLGSGTYYSALITLVNDFT